MQHGEENRPLQCELVPARAGEIGDHGAAAGLFPQPLEHQRWSDAADGNLDRGFIGGRAQHHSLGRKPRARAHQPLQLATRLQILEASQRRDHLLTHLVTLAPALHDLQIGASGRGLATKVHDASVAAVRTQRGDSSGKFKRNPLNTVALRFGADAPSAPTKSIAYVTRTRMKCRRSVKHQTAIFRQVNKDKLAAHHDALEFPDGRTVLLTRLCEGHAATVLQLPARPTTTTEADAQKRVTYVG